MIKNILLIFIIFIFGCSAYALEKDSFVNLTLKNTQKPPVHTKYNYETTRKIPIKISIWQAIKTEEDVYDGQKILFVVEKNVYDGNKLLIPEGTKINAKVETVVPNGMNGIPASIIFGGFSIDGLNGQFTETYEVFGFDASAFVFPLKWALTILYPTGSLTNFIRGGHASLVPSKEITIYYYPEWI